MGLYMSTPSTDKGRRDGSTENGAAYGGCEMQGWRIGMEDASVVVPGVSRNGAKLELYGVFDGHGGSSVSNWVSRHFMEVLDDVLVKTPNDGTYGVQDIFDHDREKVRYAGWICESLQRLFLEFDEQLRKGHQREELQALHENKKVSNAVWPDGQILDILMQHVMKTKPGNGDDEGSANEGDKSDDENIQEADKKVIEMEGDDIWADAKEGKVGQVRETNSDRPSREFDGKVCDKEMIDGIDKKDVMGEGKIFRVNSTGGTASILDMLENRDKNKKEGETSEKSERDEGDAKSDGDDANKVMDKNGKDSGNDSDYADEFWQNWGPGGSGNKPSVGKGDLVGIDNESINAANEGGDSVKWDSENGGNKPAGGSTAWQPEYCGSTSVVSALVHLDSEVVLVIANSGDSRAVLCREGVAIDLSIDHKPDSPGENLRICTAGGTVTEGRVDGNLNLSRAIGDLMYKENKNLPPKDQKISAFPDVTYLKISAKDEFLILACDGIWDCDTSQGIVNFVRRKLRDGDTPKPDVKISDVVAALFDKIISKNPIQDEGVGCDNMTCLIIDFARLKNRSKNPSEVYTYNGGE